MNEKSELERQVPHVTLSFYVATDRLQSSLTHSVTIMQASHPPNVTWYLEGRYHWISLSSVLGCAEFQTILSTQHCLEGLMTSLLEVKFSSVAQSCPTLCDPVDCSIPGFPVHHKLQDLTQTHVHQVTDAIKPTHLLSSASPPAFNLAQHQGLFQ